MSGHAGLVHVAGRVWLYPHDPDPANVQPCVTVISDDAGCVIVDAGNSPGHARRVQQAITASGLPAARTLVYTHHHWDHVWGACAWEGAEIVGHESGAPLLEADRERPWSHAYLREHADADPRLGPSFRARARAMPSWAGFEIRPPERTFGTTLTLPSGVTVTHVGGGHAEDSTVVEVPDASVLIMGDCLYPPPLHLRDEGDDEYDSAMARRLLNENTTWYVPGHSAPMNRNDLRELT